MKAERKLPLSSEVIDDAALTRDELDRLELCYSSDAPGYLVSTYLQ